MGLTEFSLIMRDFKIITDHAASTTLNLCLGLFYITCLFAFVVWIFRVIYRYWNYEPVSSSINEELRERIIESHLDYLKRTDKKKLVAVTNEKTV